MKINHLAIFLVFVLVLCSCTMLRHFGIEKRKYRQGWSIDLTDNARNRSAAPNRDHIQQIISTPVNPTPVLEKDDTQNNLQLVKEKQEDALNYEKQLRKSKLSTYQVFDPFKHSEKRPEIINKSGDDQGWATLVVGLLAIGAGVGFIFLFPGLAPTLAFGLGVVALILLLLLIVLIALNKMEK